MWLALGTCQPKAVMWSRLVMQEVGAWGEGHEGLGAAGAPGRQTPETHRTPGSAAQSSARTLHGGHTTR